MIICDLSLNNFQKNRRVKIEPKVSKSKPLFVFHQWESYLDLINQRNSMAQLPGYYLDLQLHPRPNQALKWLGASFINYLHPTTTITKFIN